MTDNYRSMRQVKSVCLFIATALLIAADLGGARSFPAQVDSTARALVYFR